MNHTDRLDLHSRAMEQKYGLLFPLEMTVKELKVHSKVIDRALEEQERTMIDVEVNNKRMKQWRDDHGFL